MQVENEDLGYAVAMVVNGGNVTYNGCSGRLKWFLFETFHRD